MADASFLPRPSAIRAALRELISGNGQLDIAVAFVGHEWRELLGEFTGKIRVVCWLSSVNTNPYAVEEMIRNTHIRVRQHDSMHAKVYVVPRIGAVIGSANLSKPALNDADTAGRCEAGVLVNSGRALTQITSWFEKLWNSPETRKITQTDLQSAKLAWDDAPANRSSPTRQLPDDSINISDAKPKLTKPELKKVLEKGRRVSDRNYEEHCKIYNAKTFYFFCEKLSEQPPSVSLSSRELNDHIRSRLAPTLKRRQQKFNPEGWFGETWTVWARARSHPYFQNEYADVLKRSRDNPYYYSIRPEYIRMVKEIFDEFRHVR